MNVKRYVAASSREALARVKKELGADAVILSNRQTANGVEILALAGKDIGAVVNAPARPQPAFPVERSLKDVAKRIELPKEKTQKTEKAESSPDTRLYSEMKAMRSLVEQQLATLAWSDDARRNPQRAQIMRELLAAGFSAAIGRKVSAALPEGQSAAQARVWLAAVLAKNLRCAGEADNLVERGGVYALVGPTGVGKTTTVAKLAARCVVRYGAARVALVTTDGYRIGAQDQLRTYARILGIPVHAVQDRAGLEHTLAALAERRLVLIDSVGMGQRDARLAEQIELLAHPRVRRLLLLNAASQVETLEDVATAYRGNGLAGAIVTKLDEARRPGGALDIAMRHRLALAFTTDGQRVPEDLHLARAGDLIERALTGAAQSPFALADSELQLLRAA